MRFALLLLLVTAACDHKSATTPASRYDQTCTSGADCSAVFIGDIASCEPKLACPNAAINNDVQQSYRDDVAKRLAPCELPESSLAGCPATILTCPAGKCEFHIANDLYTADGGNPLQVSSAGYPKACAAVDDCVAVYEGPLGCCGTPCPNVAISASSEASYRADLLGHAPFCWPPPPCPPIRDGMCTGRIDCQNGQCVLLGATP